MKHYPLATNPLTTKATPFVAVQFNIGEDYSGDMINIACQVYAGGLAPAEKTSSAISVVAVKVEASGESTMNQVNEAYHG